MSRREPPHTEPARATPRETPLRRLAQISFVVGLAALLALLISGVLADAPLTRDIAEGYLTAWWFFLGISLGSLVVMMVHGLTGGRWARHVQRPLSAATRCLPLLALLFVPLVFAVKELYPWANSLLVHEPAVAQLVHEKSWYLNEPFFFARAALYFIIWLTLASRIGRPSDAPRVWCVVGLLLYALTVTFAAVDWIMSLVPQWYSTTFGLLSGVGQGLAGFAFGMLCASLIPHLRRGVADAPREELQDLGNLVLMSVMLWAYLAFTEYLIVWSEDLRHENAWYLPRIRTSWHWLGVFLVVFQFAVPLFVLLFREAKRRVRIMLALGAGLLAVRWFDSVWVISPSLHPEGLQFHWPQFVALLAIGGVWVGGVCWLLSREADDVPQQVSECAP
jgi:hypothetical protein